MSEEEEWECPHWGVYLVGPDGREFCLAGYRVYSDAWGEERIARNVLNCLDSVGWGTVLRQHAPQTYPDGVTYRNVGTCTHHLKNESEHLA